MRPAAGRFSSQITECECCKTEVDVRGAEPTQRCMLLLLLIDPKQLLMLLLLVLLLLLLLSPPNFLVLISIAVLLSLIDFHFDGAMFRESRRLPVFHASRRCPPWWTLRASGRDVKCIYSSSSSNSISKEASVATFALPTMCVRLLERHILPAVVSRKKTKHNYHIMYVYRLMLTAATVRASIPCRIDSLSNYSHSIIGTYVQTRDERHFFCFCFLVSGNSLFPVLRTRDPLL